MQRRGSRTWPRDVAHYGGSEDVASFISTWSTLRFRASLGSSWILVTGAPQNSSWDLHLQELAFHYKIQKKPLEPPGESPRKAEPATLTPQHHRPTGTGNQRKQGGRGQSSEQLQQG